VISSKINQFGAQFGLKRNGWVFHFAFAYLAKFGTSHSLPAIRRVWAIFETKRNGVFQGVTRKVSD